MEPYIFNESDFFGRKFKDGRDHVERIKKPYRPSVPCERSREHRFLMQGKDSKYVLRAQGPREDGMFAHNVCRQDDTDSTCFLRGYRDVNGVEQRLRYDARQEPRSDDECCPFCGLKA